MSEINIDAVLVRDGDAALPRTEEKLVEFTNGCICCTLRDDLLAEVRRLTAEQRFDASSLLNDFSSSVPGCSPMPKWRVGGSEPADARIH